MQRGGITVLLAVAAVMMSACDSASVERVPVPGSNPQVSCSPVEQPGGSRDAHSAIATAKAAWASIYEKNPSSDNYSPASIARFEPYTATLRGGAWLVTGTVPSGYRGPTAVTSVCRNDEGVSTAWIAVPTVAEHVSRFIPKDAIDLVTAPEIPWLQQTFDVSRKSPEFAVGTQELERARSDGWVVCQSSDPQWIGFYDATVTPQRYVRQKIYVLYNAGVLLTLVGRYYAPNEIALNALLMESPPALQHVIVSARESTENELQETAEGFDLSCDAAAPVR